MSSGFMTPLLQTNGLVESLDQLRARVFLRPGDWLVGRGPHEVSTLLGSCVSVVLWAPRPKIGAMCHCLLPRRPRHLSHEAPVREGHYVDEALDWLASGLGRSGVSLPELQISLVGGARCTNSGIGEANVQAALQWMAQRDLKHHRCDTGGAVVRKLNWRLGTGELQVTAGGRADQ